MIRYVLIGATLILLSACAPITPQYNKLAYQCPVIKLPDDPIPFTNALTDASPPADVVKAWVATTVQYYNWNLAVRNQLAYSAE
jgi:hypothetical protein